MMCPESGCGGLVSIWRADALVDLCLLPGADILENPASCSVFSADKIPEYVGLSYVFLQQDEVEGLDGSVNCVL